MANRGLSRLGNSRKNMIRSVEDSLKRLDTDRIDLYWAHFPDEVTPIVDVQIEHSLADRTAEREVLPMAEGLGLGVALWSPLGGGFLTGKYRTGEGGRLTRLRTLVHTESSDQKTAVPDEVLAIAREIGATPSHETLAS